LSTRWLPDTIVPHAPVSSRNPKPVSPSAGSALSARFCTIGQSSRPPNLAHKPKESLALIQNWLRFVSPFATPTPRASGSNTASSPNMEFVFSTQSGKRHPIRDRCTVLHKPKIRSLPKSAPNSHKIHPLIKNWLRFASPCATLTLRAFGNYAASSPNMEFVFSTQSGKGHPICDRCTVLHQPNTRSLPKSAPNSHKIKPLIRNWLRIAKLTLLRNPHLAQHPGILERLVLQPVIAP